MWPLVFALLQGAGAASVQDPRTPPPSRTLTVYDIREAEYRRDFGKPVLAAALESGDSVLRRQAFRSVLRVTPGEFLNSALAAVDTAVPSVQWEAIRLMGEPNASISLTSRGPLSRFRDPEVRGLAYAAYGRAAGADSTAERTLIEGLRDSSLLVRRGAARGLEAWARRNRSHRPAESSALAMRQAFLQWTDVEMRRLLLPAMTTFNLRDSTVVRAGLTDADDQVRRLAVILGRVWVDDSAPMVRWQALQVAGDCNHAAAHLRDPNMHVALLAIDLLGDRKCDPAPLLPLVKGSVAWQHRAHATLALAKIAPEEGRQAARALAASPVWQARTWAARAGKVLKDSVVLNRLARDPDPNVALAALNTPRQAYDALSRDHAGLLMTAANLLKEAKLDVPGFTVSQVNDRLVATFDRISRTKPVTWRDARVALLQALTLDRLDYTAWLSRLSTDADPVIAKLAEERAERRRSADAPLPAYVPPPFPSEKALAALRGATATIRMRGLGVIRMRLLPDEAPATVHTFATLAERGAYNGRTLHRVVPNFVLQGGSPGADEYDPVTDFFMRDEVGGSHRRGTFGISTRGRDTGDGQIFINLVDNVRLDYDYTVFAETISGLDVIDRIQEGNVIESITIHRVQGASANQDRLR